MTKPEGDQTGPATPPPLPDLAPTSCTPPVVPGPLPVVRSLPPNLVGLIGLVLVSITALLSPAGVLGVTLCFLGPAGVVGVGLCLGGCFERPRWYGMVGIAVAALCVLCWSTLYAVLGW